MMKRKTIQRMTTQKLNPKMATKRIKHRNKNLALKRQMVTNLATRRVMKSQSMQNRKMLK